MIRYRLVPQLARGRGAQFDTEPDPRPPLARSRREIRRCGLVSSQLAHIS
jgi:hypothetical protein